MTSDKVITNIKRVAFFSATRGAQLSQISLLYLK